ncbi:THO complex subunit 7 homolog isoform X2 [Anabrus simplex]|uniref:THO complex subunit 7 homolog isoform X2 n=1 Tax=Anabrus simplex TaxID=316456 RepID=UPI0035A38D98
MYLDNKTLHQVAHDRMLAQLAQCEFAVTKSRLSATMSAAELQNYENLSQQIEAGIEQAKYDIERTKLEFQDAKTVRKNRIEYDVLAKVISEQPDRKETDEKLTQLRKELGSLEETREQLERKLDMRRKQFHVLVTSIHQLQAMLDDTEEIMETSLDAFDDDTLSYGIPWQRIWLMLIKRLITQDFVQIIKITLLVLMILTWLIELHSNSSHGEKLRLAAEERFFFQLDS